MPTHLRDKVSQMPAVFKNISVSHHDLSEHMAQFAESSDHLKQPRRMLVGNMKGENILLLSELFHWPPAFSFTSWALATAGVEIGLQFSIP